MGDFESSCSGARYEVERQILDLLVEETAVEVADDLPRGRPIAVEIKVELDRSAVEPDLSILMGC